MRRLLVLCCLAALLPLACAKKGVNTRNTSEKVGKSVNHAADKTGDALERAAKAVGRGVGKGAEGVKKAGDSVDENVNGK